MSRSWLSIRVDLIGGGGQDLWPRPGRILAAARSHTFAQLATAIDDAFARWDRAHLHQFDLADGARIGRSTGTTRPRTSWTVGGSRWPGSRMTSQFVYEFDFGDSWAHLCTVGPSRIDPIEQLGIVPDQPLPYWGWGDIPDQYGRRWMATPARNSAQDPIPN